MEEILAEHDHQEKVFVVEERAQTSEFLGRHDQLDQVEHEKERESGQTDRVERDHQNPLERRAEDDGAHLSQLDLFPDEEVVLLLQQKVHRGQLVRVEEETEEKHVQVVASPENRKELRLRLEESRLRVQVRRDLQEKPGTLFVRVKFAVFGAERTERVVEDKFRTVAIVQRNENVGQKSELVLEEVAVVLEPANHFGEPVGEVLFGQNAGEVAHLENELQVRVQVELAGNGPAGEHQRANHEEQHEQFEEGPVVRAHAQLLDFLFFAVQDCFAF